MVLAKIRVENLMQVRNLNLWGNELTDISILAEMPNLEVVSLSINKISSLSVFAKCPNIAEIYVRKNEIADLREVKYLQNNRKLRILWLGSNPCAQLPNYRLKVLHLLPQLQKLDDADVSNDERARAKTLVFDVPDPIVSVETAATPSPAPVVSPASPAPTASPANPASAESLASAVSPAPPASAVPSSSPLAPSPSPSPAAAAPVAAQRSPISVPAAIAIERPLESFTPVTTPSPEKPVRHRPSWHKDPQVIDVIGRAKEKQVALEAERLCSPRSPRPSSPRPASPLVCASSEPASSSVQRSPSAASADMQLRRQPSRDLSEAASASATPGRRPGSASTSRPGTRQQPANTVPSTPPVPPASPVSPTPPASSTSALAQQSKNSKNVLAAIYALLNDLDEDGLTQVRYAIDNRLKSKRAVSWHPPSH
eukprot:TRINITY_DN3961_c0_g1_i2.p1 TRINITY_DN3961_c0_g1~~TRINITY_DN3961_c0_g1_i2.p1  ORF type:complete len:436 (-),score=83.72 TRINITY_DN3961_c0_g1_i2:577-1857(-)